MTDPLTALGPADVRRWFEQGLRSLLAVRRQVDVLNVFPVPDGDTGTNLVLTLAGAARAVDRLGPDAGVAELTAAAARGALVGARGNSGVILSQAMRGLAQSAAGRESLDGPGLAAALRRAAQQAGEAVEQPVEGTVLTVATTAAQAAQQAGDQSLAGVATAAARAASAALADTRGQLPVLAERGVVDAGAAGYVVLLEALAVVVAGSGPAAGRARDALAGLWSTPRPAPTGPACALGAGGAGEDAGTAAFEVMYVLHATAPEAAALRARLATAGESVAVVGGSDGPGRRGMWQVHVHTDDPAAVLAAPQDMEQVCVRSLVTPTLGVLACTRVPGLAGTLAATGATVVVHPDAAGLERGVVDAGTRHVLLLPCDARCAALARSLSLPDTAAGALPSGTQRVDVAGTGSEVAVLAVVAEQQPGAPVEQRAAAAGVLAARVRAAACSLADVEQAATDLLDAQDEVVTAVVGRQAPPGSRARQTLLARLQSALGAVAPQAEVVVLDGGQPAPDLLLGAQ